MDYLDLEDMTLDELRARRKDIDAQIAVMDLLAAMQHLAGAVGYEARLRIGHAARPAGFVLDVVQAAPEDAPPDAAPAKDAPAVDPMAAAVAADPPADPPMHAPAPSPPAGEDPPPKPAAKPPVKDGPKAGAPWTEAEDARAIAMLGQGETLAGVAAALGRPLPGTQKRAQVAHWRARAANAGTLPTPDPALHGAAGAPAEVPTAVGDDLTLCEDDGDIARLVADGWGWIAIGQALARKPADVMHRHAELVRVLGLDGVALAECLVARMPAGQGGAA